MVQASRPRVVNIDTPPGGRSRGRRPRRLPSGQAPDGLPKVGRPRSACRPMLSGALREGESADTEIRSADVGSRLCYASMQTFRAWTWSGVAM